MSETSSFTLRYPWDKATYMHAAKIAYDHTLRHSPRRYIGWLFIALAQFGVVALLRNGTPGLLILSTVVLVYWYLLRWPIRRFLLSSAYAKSDFKEQTIELHADEEGIRIHDTPLAWSAFSKAHSLPEGFLLFRPQGFLFIPAKAFGDLETKNRFAALLKRKIPDYARID